MTPQTRYAKAGTLSIAYQVGGGGLFREGARGSAPVSL